MADFPYSPRYTDPPPKLVGRPWNDVVRELAQWLRKTVDAIYGHATAILRLDERVKELEGTVPANDDETFSYWMGD